MKIHIHNENNFFIPFLDFFQSTMFLASRSPLYTHELVLLSYSLVRMTLESTSQHDAPLIHKLMDVLVLLINLNLCSFFKNYIEINLILISIVLIPN
jgi:hypothetical protein